jgi:hypothetical protein
MRSFFPTLFILLAVTFAACSKDDEDQYITTPVLPIGTTVQLQSSGGIKLRLDEVITDSRCPANVFCVWQGMAIAKFTFTKEKKDHPFILSLTPGFPSKDTLIQGYQIEFLDLKPYPGIASDGNTIRAEMRVTKI